MRYAVVGHVEWIEFLRVRAVPRPGEIVHASASWQEPGGGGGVAAVQMARMAAEAVFFTALGDDELGRRACRELEALGVTMQVAWRAEPQRRGVTYVDDQGERTITVIGPRLGPKGEDPLDWSLLEGCQAVYFTAGDRAALMYARKARVLASTPRVLSQLSGVELDALIGSANDDGERFQPEALDPRPRLSVLTEGGAGGSWSTSDGRQGRFAACPLPGPVADAYGCGDTFAAALTYALGAGEPLQRALEHAARQGAVCLTGRGPYSARVSGLS